MNKLFLAVLAVCLLSVSEAKAGWSFSFGFGPRYVPAPVYPSPYCGPRPYYGPRYVPVPVYPHHHYYGPRYVPAPVYPQYHHHYYRH